MELFSPLQRIARGRGQEGLTNEGLHGVFGLSVFSFPDEEQVILSSQRRSFIRLNYQGATLAIFMCVFNYFRRLRGTLFYRYQGGRSQGVNGQDRALAGHARGNVGRLLTFVFRRVPFIRAGSRTFLILLGRERSIRVLAFSASNNV